MGYNHMLRGLYVCWCRVHVASPGAVTLLAAATSASAVSAVFGRSENAINDEGNTIMVKLNVILLYILSKLALTLPQSELAQHVIPGAAFYGGMVSYCANIHKTPA